MYKRQLDDQPYCWPTWSWDNRYLLCAESQDGTSRLLRISVADGQTRELLNLKTRAERASFSPDGRFVAYQVQPTSEADPVSRIFTLPADGGEPQLVYEERQNGKFLRWLKPCKLLDWTADGRYLAIASEHTGRGALDLDVYKRQTSFFDAFKLADDLLRQAVQGISDIINTPGIINRDFADVKATMFGLSLIHI